MKWQQGRTEIDKMLADGELELVQASREHADRLINQARRHLDSAEATCESDPEGAYGTCTTPAASRCGRSWPTRDCDPPPRAATSPSTTR